MLVSNNIDTRPALPFLILGLGLALRLGFLADAIYGGEDGGKRLAHML